MRIDELELLRLVAPVLAGAADYRLNSPQAPNFEKKQTFYETIRTQFRFLGLYLEQLARERTRTKPLPHLDRGWLRWHVLL